MQRCAIGLINHSSTAELTRSR